VAIDINCDMGESFGRYKLGGDEAIMPHITSANIACGVCAGDPLVMSAAVRCASAHGVSIGAHPGFPDLQGFGRREMNLTPEEIEAFVIFQIGALAGFVRSAGAELAHVKPHGALYNMAARDWNMARAIARAVAGFSKGLVFVGLSGSVMIEAGVEAGLRVARGICRPGVQRRWKPPIPPVAGGGTGLSTGRRGAGIAHRPRRRRHRSRWRGGIHGGGHALHPRRHAVRAGYRPGSPACPG